MKYRLGFVSNSSSSSFLIKMCFMGVEKYINTNENYKDSIIQYSDGVYGVDIDYMKEDESKSDFRHRVYEELKRIGFDGLEKDVDFICIAYEGS